MNLWQSGHLPSVQGSRAGNSEPWVHPHALVSFSFGLLSLVLSQYSLSSQNGWVAVVLTARGNQCLGTQCPETPAFGSMLPSKLSFSVSRGSNGLRLYSSGDTTVLGRRMAPQSQGCLTVEDLLPKDGVSTRSSAPAAPDKRWPVLTRRLPQCLSSAFLFQTVSL